MKDKILDTASVIFNREGLTHASMEEIAADLGLTKPALYYYFKGKEDLLHACYARACELGERNLAQARQAGGTGLDKIVHYLSLQLSVDIPPVAVLREVQSLKPEQAADIVLRSRKNDELLRGFIVEGLADGSIADCDVRMANFAMMGSVSWIGIWIKQGPAYLPYDEIGIQFTDIFVNGLSAPGYVLQKAFPALNNMGRFAGNAFDRTLQSQAKTDTLLRAATQTFNRGGYDNVSVEDVARSLGVTKGAFYHYFVSKQELLFQCYQRTLDLTEHCLAEIEAEGGDGFTCLRKYISRVIGLQAGPTSPLAVFNRVLSLSPSQRREIRRRGRQQQHLVQSFIERGIKDGSIREVNPLMARLAVVGALNWLPKWHKPDGDLSPDEMADQFDRFFALGLANPDGKTRQF